MSSIVFEVGSPPRLVEYIEGILPGGLVHPVPKNQEVRACHVYRKKVSLLCKALNELNHYIRVVNYMEGYQIFNHTIQGQLLEITVEADQVFGALKRLCKRYKSFPRINVREMAIMAVNKYRIMKFKVNRLVYFISRLASASNTLVTFPVSF